MARTPTTSLVDTMQYLLSFSPLVAMPAAVALFTVLFQQSRSLEAQVQAMGAEVAHVQGDLDEVTKVMNARKEADLAAKRDKAERLVKRALGAAAPKPGTAPGSAPTASSSPRPPRPAGSRPPGPTGGKGSGKAKKAGGKGAKAGGKGARAR